MSAQMYHAQVGQEEEREWLDEVEARRVEDANAIADELRAAREEAYAKRIAELFPELKSWPGKDQK